jgi:DNA-binding Lrp family transcriptional regulator
VDLTDCALLRELENGLPLASEPFEELGNRLHISGTEVMKRLRLLQADGIIRKITVRINQRQIGITANALVAWRIPDEGNPEMYARFASFPGVSHCYVRRPMPGKWEYTLYTVHHGRSRERVLAEVSTLAQDTGISDYVVLFSTEEFKRVPAVRISENGGDLP